MCGNLDPIQKDAGLPIRQIRHADTGHSKFIILGRSSAKEPLGTPASPLSSNITQLASRWVYMLSGMPASNPSNAVPARLGNDPTLDTTAAYMWNCHQAYLTRNENDVRVARSSGNKAMQCVRKALVLQGSDFSDFVLLSATLLLAAQYLIGIQRIEHQVHAVAISQMLKERWIRGRWGILEERLTRNVVGEETGASIFAGKVSGMDDPLRLKARSLTMKDPVSTVLAASSAISDNLILIPRLLIMARQLVKEQDDSQHTIETLNLAKSVLDDPSTTMIKTFIRDQSITSDSIENPLGRCITYLDDDTFGVAVFYSLWRSVICAVVHLILERVSPVVFAQYFDRDKVEAEDIEVAENLAMSIDFAFQKGRNPPFNSVRICTPLMVSAGAWKRLQKRLDGGDTSGFEHAARMKTLAFDTYNRGVGLWYIPPTPHERIERLSDAYSGGKPLPQFSHRK